MTSVVLAMVLAAGAPRAQVASSDSTRALASRVKAELVGRGFVVSSRESQGLVFEPATLEAEAAGQQVEALVALRSTEAVVEVWVCDRQARQVVVRSVRSPDDEALVALEVGELLRVGSLEASQRRLATVAPASTTAPAVEARPSMSGWVAVGGSALGSLGGLSPSALAHVRVGLVAGWFEPGLEGGVMLVPTRFEGAGVSISATLVRALLRAGVRLPLSTTFSLVLGLSGGVSSFTATGAVSAPRVGQTRSLVSFTGGGSIELEWRLGSRLSLRPSVRVEVMGPRPVLTVEGAPVAAFGLPLFSAGLEAQVALW